MNKKKVFTGCTAKKKCQKVINVIVVEREAIATSYNDADNCKICSIFYFFTER